MLIEQNIKFQRINCVFGYLDKGWSARENSRESLNRTGENRQTVDMADGSVSHVRHERLKTKD